MNIQEILQNSHDKCFVKTKKLEILNVIEKNLIFINLTKGQGYFGDVQIFQIVRARDVNSLTRRVRVGNRLQLILVLVIEIFSREIVLEYSIT